MANVKIITDVLAEDTAPLGVLGSGETFGLEPEDRKGNMYLVGQPGTGKSILVENILISDLVKSRGGLMIDPYGDLVEDVLQYADKDQVVVFEVAKGDGEFNIKKFNDEVDLSVIEEDKFVLCKLSYPVIGSHVSREVGKHILNEFYKLDQLENTSLIIDEFQNYVDEGQNIAQNKEKGVMCVLAEHTVHQYSKEGIDQLLNVVDHIMCYRVDRLTTRKMAKYLGIEEDQINNLEKFQCLVRLTVGGEKTDIFSAVHVFPIPYPKK